MEDHVKTINGKESTPFVSWDDTAWENPFEASMEQGRREGREMGYAAGYEEGRRIGCAVATEIGMEVGFILGCCEEILGNLSALLGEGNMTKREKVISNIEVLKKLINDHFDTSSRKDQSSLLRNYSSSYPLPEVQKGFRSSNSSMGESPINSDAASKALATSYEEVSSIFSNDLDIPKVLQNVRSRVSYTGSNHSLLPGSYQIFFRNQLIKTFFTIIYFAYQYDVQFKLILIQIKIPNHTYQNVIEWTADDSVHVRKSNQEKSLMASFISSSLEEW
jgi:hypothetical protein